MSERPESVHKGLITEGISIGDMTTVARPSRNERVFNRTLYEKKKIGDLTEPEINRFKKFLRVKSSGEE